MVDAVAARTAPSPRDLQQGVPQSGMPVPDAAGPAPATMEPSASDRNDAVILDLSDQARAALARASTGSDDPPGLTRVEKRFKLMTEYTALQQELTWLSDRAAAHALGEMFQGATAPQGETGTPDKQEQFNRDMQRREELMPRYAELIRMLGALPGQDGSGQSS